MGIVRVTSANTGRQEVADHVNSAVTTASESTAAPGSVVVIRDAEWLITHLERATDGWFVHVQGLSELVKDTEATFSTALDDIQESDPRNTQVVPDDSPGYRKSRLWLEAMLRKTAIPATAPNLTVAHRGLADPLPEASGRRRRGRIVGACTTAYGSAWELPPGAHHWAMRAQTESGRARSSRESVQNTSGATSPAAVCAAR